MRSIDVFYLRAVFHIRVATLTTALVILSVGQYSAAATPVTIKLWENGAPGTPATKPQDEPILLMTLPASSAVDRM